MEFPALSSVLPFTLSHKDRLCPKIAFTKSKWGTSLIARLEPIQEPKHTSILVGRESRESSLSRQHSLTALFWWKPCNFWTENIPVPVKLEAMTVQVHSFETLPTPNLSKPRIVKLLCSLSLGLQANIEITDCKLCDFCQVYREQISRLWGLSYLLAAWYVESPWPFVHEEPPQRAASTLPGTTHRGY